MSTSIGFCASDDSRFARVLLARLFVPAVILLLPVRVIVARETAEETVYLSSRQGGSGHLRLSGRVIDYTGERLELELAGGRREVFPAERVLWIDGPTTDEQTQAELLFAEGDFVGALDGFRQARRVDTRVWMQRRITSRIVWCYRSMGQSRAACDEFALLLSSDPKTVHFDCIPMAWRSLPASAELERAARGHASRADRPALALLGASHLLSTDARGGAIVVLRRLANNPDARIAALAVAQLWRVDTIRADPERIARWQQQVDRMPRDLRAGPYFVVGRAWAGKQVWAEAALAYLHVPILYPNHRHLSGAALVEAASALQRTGATEEAARLYREVLTRFPDTPAAREAKLESRL